MSATDIKINKKNSKRIVIKDDDENVNENVNDNVIDNIGRTWKKILMKLL